MNRFLLSLAVVALLGLTACGPVEDKADTPAETTEETIETNQQETDSDMSADTPDPASNPEVEAAITQGLIIQDTEVGAGAEVMAGTTAEMHYTGWLYDDSQPDNKGEKFDSSYDRGQPLPVEFGVGRVIKGWDLGVLGMKEGGKRTLVIPPELGYGQRGTPGGPIPPNATLLFEVEVVDIK